MKITDVRIFPYSSKKSSLVAFANVTFDKCFVVRNFRVFDGKNGLFAACPSEEMKNGEYSDTAFPITKEFRIELLDAIVEAFEDYDEDDRPKKKKSKRVRDVDEDELPD